MGNQPLIQNIKFRADMTNGLKDNDQQQQFVAIKNLVIQASRSNSWIFNSVTKEWHNPEEFEAKYIDLPFQSGWYQQFKVLNPLEGLSAADKQIQKILKKKANLIARVFKYYESKL
ncbi:hypothetical protein CLV32_4601 [Pedobacter duraquae]|uniref:Uncharacterized protein n=1 Tax=Pedobacter duraquae TaxID=425511 RepID=A0A4R6ICM4_9SPHI|nr:hypothetical protein CLV32_4601 [Pedobacter duraquae]